MRALGLIEVIGLPGAIEAADSALKAANVTLLQVTKVGSGIMTVEITGDVGAVTAAVEAGAEAASRIATLRAKQVIPRMDDALLGSVIPADKFPGKSVTKNNDKVNSSEEKKNENVDFPTDNKGNSEIENTEIKDEEIKDTVIGNPGEQKNEVVSPKDGSNINEMEESLLKKSSSQLRNMITNLGVSMTQDEMKRLKKQELVAILEKHLKESIEKGDR